MAGRFPGARNLDEFWRNLRAGVESISFFSDEELETNEAGKPGYVKARAILSDADKFDADFFAINPREAEDAARIGSAVMRDPSMSNGAKSRLGAKNVGKLTFNFDITG